MTTTIGTLHVRRSAFIQATANRIWEEFASFDRFGAWFGIGHSLHAYEPELDGSVELSVELDGARQYYGGTITVFDVAREVNISINWRDPLLAWAVPMMWTIRLTPVYDGTTVEVFHHGFERLGAAAAEQLEGFEEGWDNKHLRALRSIVEH